MELPDLETVLGTAAAIAACGVLVVISCAIERFFDRHPRLKSALCWIGGILLALALLSIPMVGVLVGFILGLVIIIRRWPETRRKEKAKMDAFMARRRQELAADMEQWERKKALEQLERGSLRTQADELEKKARHWEYYARKTHAASDIRQAEYYRDLANAARKKVY